MKWISLAPSYDCPQGHGIAYQTCLYNMCQSLKMPFIVLFPKKNQLPSLTIPFRNYFSSHFKLFDFIRLFIQQKEPSLYFIESFKIVDLSFLLLALLFLKRQDRFLLLFRYGLRSLCWEKWISLFLIKGLSRYNQVHFLTDSELIAAEYEKEGGVKLQVVPIPHTHVRKQKAMRKSDKLICYWPGEPRPSKGLSEIKQLTERMDRERFELVAVRSSELKNAHLIKDYLTREEYLFYLERSDLVLLPYDPLVYQKGTSGIFVEAVCLGKMPLVKEGSWLAYELRKYELDELIVEWQDPDFFTKLEELYASENVRKKLSWMSSEYNHFHTQASFNDSFHKFLEMVLGKRCEPETLLPLVPEEEEP